MNYNNYSKEYVVNNFLKLRLEQGRTHIYVKNRLFMQCMYLLLNIQTDKIRQYDNIDSIDEAAEILDRSMEGGGRIGNREIEKNVGDLGAKNRSGSGTGL